MLRTLFMLLGAVGAVALAGSPDTTLASAVTLVIAAAVLAVISGARVSPGMSPVTLVQPRASIDVSVVPAQCDPDASGHPRPRAPGVAAAAA